MTDFRDCDWPPALSERPLEETEKSLQTLIKLASNPECIPSLLDGLAGCLDAIMLVSERCESTTLPTLVSNLLSGIIQVRGGEGRGGEWRGGG